MLIDAKASLSVVAKDRTNAHAFFTTLCSINAHLLVSNTLLRPLYVPSEDNPADAPSRGRRRRPVDRRVLKKAGKPTQDKELYHILRESRLVRLLLDRNKPTPYGELKAALKAACHS